jgi:hypothetical protein
MKFDVLRVLPRGTARVPDYAALTGTRTNRFHGWVADKTIGAKFIDADSKAEMRHLVHVKKLGLEHVIEIRMNDPHIGEYIRHLRDGDLWPADQETATRVGVKFDPTFGGEHHDEAKAAQDADLAEIKLLHGVV